jgi:lysozyme
MSALGPKVRVLAATLVISAAGLAGIKRDEGDVRKVYLDPVGIPTVCVGHTATVTHKDVGKTYSAETCTYLLKQDTRQAVAAVQRLVKAPLTQQQFDALVSFTFNVGVANFQSSTLLKQFNAGQCHAAADQFQRWNKARGKVLRGLTIRRAHEAAALREDCP